MGARSAVHEDSAQILQVSGASIAVEKLGLHQHKAARHQISELVINWHITEACNYSCKYCYASWQHAGKEASHSSSDVAKILQDLHDFFSPDNQFNPLRQVMDWQSVRLNLAGGEPLLYPSRVVDIVQTARRIGFSTSLITNASRLTPELARTLAPELSVLGVSMDSASERQNLLIGRSEKGGVTLSPKTLSQVLSEARSCNPGLKVKINTVINAINCGDEMSSLIRQLAPNRWKVLRMLPLVTTDLSVSDADFQGFVARHRHLADVMCVEDNSDMVESYLMIDPHGRFFQNDATQAAYRYSRKILEVGTARAFSEINIEPEKFCARYTAPAFQEAA